MFKNLLLLGALTWVSFSYAKGPSVAKENISESENFRVEKPMKEKDAQRSLAGSKAKKQKNVESSEEKPIDESDSDVRYWQYSE